MQCNLSCEEILKSGNNQLAQGKYSQALDTFLQALCTDSKNLKILVQIGVAYYHLRDQEEALKYLDRALRIDEQYIPALSQRGLVYKQKNQGNSAKSDWELVINKSAQTYDDWMGKSRAFFELGDFDQCLNSLDRASKLNPDAYEPWMYRGIALGDREPLQAIKSHNKAIALNPDAYEPWIYKGITLVNMGESHRKEAIKSFSKAIALNSNADQAWMRRGITRGNMGNNLDALSDFSKAISLNPDTDAWLYQGISQSNVGKRNEALNSFNCGIEKNPGDVRLLWHRGIVKYKMKLFKDALDDYDRAIAINTSDEKIWDRRSDCIRKLIKLRDLAIVSTSRKRITKITPDNAVGWFWHGNILRELEQHKEAINSYRQATEIDPSRKESWYWYGFCLESLKEYRAAITVYQKSIIIDISYTDAYYNIGNIFRYLGDLEAALENYKKVVKLDPDHADAWYYQGKVLGLLGRHKEALFCYEKTIHIQPNDYAAYNEKGNSLTKIFRFTDAIVAFEKSLIHSDYQYWKACRNRGWAYINSRQEGCEFVIKIWEDGLKMLNKKSDRVHGILCHDMGKLYYREGIKKHQIIFLEQAREKYKLAISHLESDPSLRKKYLDVLLDLYTVQIVLKEKEQAAEIQRISAELLTRIIEECSDLDQKAKIAYEFRELNCLTVDSLIQSDQLVKALETAEQGKNACLTWLLSGWKEKIATPDWEKMLELTNDKTAIVYWHLSSISINIFLIKSNESDPILISSSKLVEDDELFSNAKINKFEEWMNKWNDLSGSDSQEEWHVKLPELIYDLKKIFDISLLLPQIENITKLILIPHRDLHRIPLHLLFSDDLIVTYLPSIQTGINLPTTKFSTNDKLLTIECSGVKGKALFHTEIEPFIIADFFHTENVHKIPYNDANKSNIVGKMKGEYSFLHFTGHAEKDLKDPRKSALVLANNDRLTVEDILSINLNKYHLVTLAACETAITSNYSITEEYVGLVSAFLYQRVEHVLSTLWPVQDHQTSLMMAYFYSQLTKGKSPADALSESSKWLKTITHSELRMWYDNIIKKLSTDDPLLRPYLSKRIIELDSTIECGKNDTCFKNDHCWASFIITGK